MLEPEIIFLSEADMERAKRIAHARNDFKVAGTHKNLGPATMSTQEMHWIGVRAELAVCKRFQFPIDERLYLQGDKGAADLYVGELRGEIKSSKHRPPIIKLKAVTDFKSDVLIMCYVDSKVESRIEIWGYVTRQQFIEHHEVTDFGHGPRATMGPKHFFDHRELDEMIKHHMPVE